MLDKGLTKPGSNRLAMEQRWLAMVMVSAKRAIPWILSALFDQANETIRADMDLEKTMVVKEVMAGVVDMEGMVGAVMAGDHTRFHIGKVVADTGQAVGIGLEAGGRFLVGDGGGGHGGIMVVATRRRLRNQANRYTS
nr:hypothetical protein [Tanacetum cinerariifolium]